MCFAALVSSDQAGLSIVGLCLMVSQIASLVTPIGNYHMVPCALHIKFLVDMVSRCAVCAGSATIKRTTTTP
jgi:hypothetical protein